MKKLGFFLTFLFAILFLSCEIGLGSSVDTEAPVLDILNPPADAIIRDDFTISGNWSDDGSISAISVKLTRLDGEGTFSFKGNAFTDKDGKGKWTIPVTALTDGIADGTYEAVVEINDNGGHKTTMARSFTIDNTPPVMILQKPSTPASDNLFDTFGQIFSIVGQAADDSLVDKIDIKVYSSADCSDSSYIKTVTLGNVPPTIDLNVAVFEEGVNNDYAQIYGQTTKGSDPVARYFMMEVYDNARKYLADGSVEEEGNKQTTYYLYKEISDLITEYKATGLYKIQSGNTSGLTARTISPETAKNTLEQKKIAKGQFKLNPNNSPIFTVSARSLLAAGTTLEDTAYQLTSGNNYIEIQVDPGLDNLPIDKDSVGLYLLQCNDTGTPLNNNKIWLFQPVTTENTTAHDNITITPSGDSYKFKTSQTISSVNYAGLQTGNYYRIYVDGHDTENPIVSNSNGIYAFKLVSSGSFIELGITPEQANVTSNASSVAASGSVAAHPQKNKQEISLRYQGGASYFIITEAIGSGASQVIKDSSGADIIISGPASAITTSTGDTISTTLANSVLTTKIIKPITSSTSSGTISYQVKSVSSNDPATYALGDAASSVKSVNLIVDNTPPDVTGSVTVGSGSTATAHSNTSFYDKQYLNINGSFTDVYPDSVYYYVKSASDTLDVDAQPFLGDITGHDEITISDSGSTTSSQNFELKNVQFSAGENTLYIQAMDKSGNPSDKQSFTFNVDTSAPTITTTHYKKGSTSAAAGGTVYVQNGTQITLYGNYSDLQSGVQALKLFKDYGEASEEEISSSNVTFTYSTTAIEGTIPTDYAAYNTANAAAYRSWSAVFNTSASISGSLTVEGKNRAGLKSSTTTCNFTIDSEDPSIENIKLKEITGSGASAVAKDAYLKASDSKYYINNTVDGKTFRISGVSTDNFGVESVSLTVTNTGTTNSLTFGPQATSGSWSFDIAGMETWTSSAAAEITATDKAGRTKTETVNIVFDTTAPKAMHWADAKWKDIYFRIGNADNDNATDAANTDVGSKYSFGSWGNDSTIEIRGNFYEAAAGSGLKAIHYAIFDDVPTSAQITALENGTLTSTETNHVKVIGSFEPLASPVTKTVSYNKTEAGLKTTKSVDTNFRTQLAGFNEQNNYLVLVAEDNAGNRAADDLKVTEGTTETNGEKVNNGNPPTPEQATNTWNSQNHNTATAYYSINKDTLAPNITSNVVSGVYTNGEGNGSITISGTASDAHSGIKNVVISMDDTVITTISADAFTDPNNDDVFDTWSTTIPVSTFAGAAITTGRTYTLYAKATDNAGVGNSKQISAGTITIDKEDPAVSNLALTETTGTGSSAVTKSVYSITSTNAGVTTTNYYLNNTVTEKAIKISGLATDNYGVQSVSLDVETNPVTSPATKLQTQTLNNPTGTWEFTIGTATDNWSGWTSATGATAKVKVTDKAGNTKLETLNIVFDRIAPVVDSDKLTVPNASQTEASLFKFEGGEECVAPEGSDTVFSGYDKVDIAFTNAPASGQTLTAPSSAQTTANVASDGSWSSTVEFTNAAYGSIFSTQGTKYLWVRAYDNAGNAGAWVSKAFVYDKAAPTISFTAAEGSKNPASGSYRNSGFTFEVNASDTYGVDKVEVLYGDQTVEMGLNASGKYEKAFKVGSETTANAVLLADAAYNFTIKVTDKAGKTNTLTRTITVDTNAPSGSFDRTAFNPLGTEIEINGTTNRWYKSTSIKFAVAIAASEPNISTVEISKDNTNNTNWESMSLVSGKFTGTLSGLTEGVNTVYAKMTDLAGNTNTINTDVYVDSIAPTTLTAYDSVGSQINGTLLTNQSADKEVYIEVEDEVENNDSSTCTGIDAVTFDTISGILQTSGIHNGRYKITIPKAKQTGNINITVTDKAGNSARLRAFRFDSDTTPPVVAVSSPVGTTVYGTKTVTGTVTENNPRSVSLYYRTTAPSAATAPDATGSGWTLLKTITKDPGTDTTTIDYEASDSAIYTWSVADVDFNTKAGVEATTTGYSKPIYFLVYAEDMAGNKSIIQDPYYTKTYTVDLDANRPVIQFTNGLALSSTMAAAARVNLADRSLNGNVTDTEGVTKLEYKTDKISGQYYSSQPADWTTTAYYSDTACTSAVTSFTADTYYKKTPGTYSEVTLVGGSSFSINLDDGSQNISFKVTTGSGESEESFETSETEAFNLASPKIKDGASSATTFGYSDSAKKATALFVKVDTQKPDVSSLEYTKTPAAASSWSTASETYGGKSNIFYIRQFAYDANGIVASTSPAGTTASETRLKIEKKSGDITSGTGAVAGYASADTNYYYYALTEEQASTRTISGKTGTEWRSSAINTNGMETGTRKAIIEIFDGTSSKETEVALNIDNTAPVISVKAPDSSQPSSGNVPANGETDLTDWKNTSSTDTPKEFMYFALSLNNTTSPAADDSDANIAAISAITSWKDADDVTATDPTGGNATISFKPYYTPIVGGSYNWYVYFDGGSTGTNTHAPTVKQFLIDSGITSETNISNKSFTTIVKAFLWIKAVDEVGNETVIKHPILIDPQGDIPTVTIEYPETSGTTLGGDVSLRGSANDTIGNTVGVDSVWLQIISAKEYNFDSSLAAYHTSGTRTTGGLSFTDTVTTSTDETGATTYSHAYELVSFAPKMKDVKQWINAESSGNKIYEVYKDIDGTPVRVSTVGTGTGWADDDDGSAYFIKANYSGSSAWTLKINKGGEFNPGTGKLNPLAYRVYAKDKDGNLSRPQEQLGVFDSDNPVISNLYLRQYDTDGNVTASRPYEDDMWVRGAWYLCGSVGDTDGLSSLLMGPETSKTEQLTSAEISGSTTNKEFKYLLSSGSGVGNLSIHVEATDKASTPHTEKKVYSINYDNTPPVMVTSGANYRIDTDVINSNGFYTFGSQVTENEVGGKAQSGFAYLAFWFERNISGKDHIVYDVMRAKANSEVAYSEPEDGLVWKTKTVTRSEDSLGTLTLSAADANIHAGGLCKVGGSIYFIRTVSGTTVTLDGQPEYDGDENHHSTVKFAIANVVNKEAESGSGAKAYVDGKYGYYATMSGDDGDNMLESVAKQGTTWTWEANINSQNMNDGTVTLHYVAFDKAGNSQPGQVTVNIANNAPRIASLKVWSDFNENGTEESGESETKYFSEKERKVGGSYVKRATGVTSELVVSGNNKDYTLAEGETEYGSAFMTVKATTRFIPELVGGNSNLYYSYKYGNKTQLAGATVHYADATIGAGRDDGIDEDVDANGYYKADQNGVGYIDGYTIGDPNDNTSHYIEIPGTLENETDSSYTLNKLGNSASATDPTWFEYTIYDSTDGCATWNSAATGTSGRLSATFRVALNLQYQDSEAPVVKIRPFYWNSKTDNSVSWTTGTSPVAEGHIELESDLTDNIKGNGTGQLGMGDDPKVSGKIKVEGYAYDDIKLKYLYVQMLNHTALNTAQLASTYTGTWSAKTYADGWGFTAEDVYCNGNGHLVHWTLTVDTAARTNVAALDQSVVVYAKDARANLESEHDDENPDQTSLPTYVWGNVKEQENALTTYYTDFYCNTKVTASTPDSTVVYKASDLESMNYYYKMDIVPYITDVKRNSAYNTHRSGMGNYPLMREETGNTITGFNLGETSKAGLCISSTSNAITGVDVENFTVNASGNSATFKIPATAVDGYLQYYVQNGTANIPALNNMNKNVAYTKEEGDTRWYDDRYVRIWQSNANDKFAASYPTYPAMAMGSNGDLFMSYTFYSKSVVYYNQLMSTTKTQIFTAGDQPEETDIMVNGTNEVNVIYQANHHYGGSQDRWSAQASGAGSINLYNPSAPDVTTYAKGRYWRFEGCWHNQMLQQLKNAKVVASGNVYHTIWYDKITKAIKYSNVNKSATQNAYIPDDSHNDRPGEIGWVVLDGDADLDDIVQTNQRTTNGYNGGEATYPNNPFNHSYLNGVGNTSMYSIALSKTPAQRTAIMNLSENTRRKNAAINANANYTRYDYTGAGSGTAGYNADCYENVNPTSTCGEYAAICVTSDGYPVVVYFDVDNKMLKVARGISTNPKGMNTENNNDGAAAWRIQQVALTSGHLGNDASYVSAVIDSDGYLHIAFQNSRGELIYTRSTNTASALTLTQGFTFGDSVIVDTNGTWASITVDSNNVPQIAYMANTSGYDTLKLAYPVESATALWTAATTWETMYAPMNAKSSNVKTCVVARPSNATGGQPTTQTDSYWKTGIGFATSEDYRVMKYIGSGTKTY